MSIAKRLDVYRGADLVGALYDEYPIRFVYDETWRHHNKESVSPNISLSQTEHSGQAVEAYFENLLPEAGIRDLLKLKHQVTTTFGLLSVIGGDTASDLTILPEGDQPKPPQYQSITWQDVADEFQQQQGVIQKVQAEDGVRISLAGAQRKLSICIDLDGNPTLPLGNSPSTYIGKPDIKGVEGVWASAINETFVTTLGSKLGIGVAEVFYQPIAKACIIKRYDRVFDKSGQIKRLHQLDLCQIDGKPSTVKYETDGGPTLLRCKEILNDMGAMAADTKRFIQWIFFNLYVGNNDSHAKNLSVYFLPNQGVKLTPFYDLLSTSLYPGLSRKFAFKIGQENTASKITKIEIVTMSEMLGFKPKYILKIAEKLANDLLVVIDDVANEINQVAAAGTEITIVERLHQHISSNTKSFQKRLFVD
jgi:serine/threonine-protein kinase HipA